MKNHKLIKIVDEIYNKESINIRIEVINIDYEYLLRYFEIHNEHLIKKYKTLFSDLWEDKLIRSFLFLYNIFENNNDVRILNVLYKYRKVVRNMSIRYQHNKMELLIFSRLKVLVK